MSECAGDNGVAGNDRKSRIGEEAETVRSFFLIVMALVFHKTKQQTRCYKCLSRATRCKGVRREFGEPKSSSKAKACKQAMTHE